MSDNATYVIKATYVTKAFKSLQVLYTNFTFITRLARLLHRVCDAMQTLHTTTNLFISYVKKYFTKAPRYVQVFHKV